MARKAESIPLSDIESYILRFGPLSSAQINDHFGFAHHSLGTRLKKSIVLKSIMVPCHQYRKGRTWVWWHINGNKPEGVTE